MMPPPAYSRRQFIGLSLAALASLQLGAQGKRRVPLGILTYAVQSNFDKDTAGTLTALAKMGFEGVEMTRYSSADGSVSSRVAWSPARAREIRSLLDGAGLRCFSTHNEAEAFTPEGLKQAVEINQILGCPNICCVRGLERNAAAAGSMTFERLGLDNWKKIADALERTAESLRPLKMTCTFHNHAIEFVPVDGVKPIDLLAKAKGVAFHIDVNVCRGTGTDLVAFIKQYPGRINSLLLTDGPPAGKQRPLIGQGQAPWKEIFAAAENEGGVQYYLLAQAGGGLPPMEAIGREIEQYQRIHG